MGIISSCILKGADDNIPFHELRGKFKAKVVSVYDGDTINVVILNIFSCKKYKVRMYGYDSPEMKPLLTMKNRKKEITNAIKAKKYLASMILNKIVIVDTKKRDKYGRLLATIYVKSSIFTTLNVNQIMIDKKYGKPYYGGRKK